jgi:aryl-alcohol dehydrogenase-like predicted oxidoreductase
MMTARRSSVTVFVQEPTAARIVAGMATIGLGLAAVGRPGYINLGHAGDLPPGRSVEALRTRAHQLLDQAHAGGVRYVDVARSYGLAEEFLASWFAAHPDITDVVVGSKWGYTYTAGWRVDATVHEVKDHSVATFDRQLAETRALLGDRLGIYQIHSVTPDSPALTDPVLHRRLAGLAAAGVIVGLSTSGPSQAATIKTALQVRVDSAPLFRSIQSTWNLLEPAAGAALAEAHAAGCTVIVKEALANGRLAGRQPSPVLDEVAAAAGSAPDAVALAAVLHQPWATVVLSGASTGDQLAANLRATGVHLSPGQRERLSELAEPSAIYWATRAGLAWT